MLVRFGSGISRVIFQRTWIAGRSVHLPLPNPSHHARPADRHRQSINTFPAISACILLSCRTGDGSCNLPMSDTDGSPPS